MDDHTKMVVEIIKQAKRSGGDWCILLRVMSHVLRRGRRLAALRNVRSASHDKALAQAYLLGEDE